MKKTTRISNKAQAGFTVIELAISAAVLGVIISMISAFLTSSLHVNELNVARGELNSNLSLAMELITSEIYSAGSIGVDADGTENTCNLDDVNSAAEPAFSVDSIPDTTVPRHEFTIRYCDPYTRTAQKVSYKVEADSDNNNLLTLKRNKSELTNGDFPAGSYTPMIPGIVGLELDLECKPTDTTDCDPIDSDFKYSDILAVTVKIAAQTTFESKNAYQDKYYFSLVENEDTEIDAEYGYIYEYAQQTVRPINLTMTVLP